MVPHIGEVKQIRTHKGPSDKPLFLDIAPFIKSTTPSPLLFLHENYTENYQFSNYSSNICLHLCVSLSNFSVSCSPEMQFCVIHLKSLGSTQPYVAFLTLIFCSCLFAFCGTCTVPNSLALHWPVSVVSCVKSFQ
jgi:hypothetical protein